MKPCRSLLTWSLVFFLAAQACLAQGEDEKDCSGHGSKVEGKCVCSDPLPTKQGSGWIGDECDQEVHHLPADGSGTAAELNPKETKCWATSTSSPESPSNFFSFLASVDKGKSPVDVHGLVAVPTAWHKDAPIRYPNSSLDWDYSSHVSEGPPSRVQLLGEEAVRAQWFGLFLCATPSEDEGSIVTVHASGHACMDDCNNWRGQKRGECQEDGHCKCEANWLGATCDVAASNSTSKCQPGSSMPEHLKGDSAGTCWHPCNKETGSYDEKACADFTCEPTDDKGVPLRRKGDAHECVSDECVPGTHHMVPDPAGSSVCEKKCVCPTDGDSCELDDTCVPDTIKCLNGLVKIKHPDGSIECGPSTELSCEEGTLKQDFTVEGGTVYGVCVCGAAKLRARTPPSGLNCTFTSPLPPGSPKDAVKADGGIVVCDEGHEVVGARRDSIVLSDGRKLQGGGKCTRIVHVHKGVSVPLVFLWCLFSVALGPVLVILVRRAYIWHQTRQVDIGDDEGGMGESLLGNVRSGWETFMDRVRERFGGTASGGRGDRGYGDSDPNSW